MTQLLPETTQSATGGEVVTVAMEMAEMLEEAEGIITGFMQRGTIAPFDIKEELLRCIRWCATKGNMREIVLHCLEKPTELLNSCPPGTKPLCIPQITYLHII